MLRITYELILYVKNHLGDNEPVLWETITVDDSEEGVTSQVLAGRFFRKLLVSEDYNYFPKNTLRIMDIVIKFPLDHQLNYDQRIEFAKKLQPLIRPDLPLKETSPP